MQKARDRRNIFTTLLAALVVLSSVSALGQAPITAPLFNVLDFSGDTGAFPLLEVQGGQTSSTLGIEVTSQSLLTSPPALPPLNVIMPAGFGGLSLVQTGGLTNTSAGAGQGSPVFSMCAQQVISTGINTTNTGYACWNWQVSGGGSTANAPDVLNLTRTTQNGTHNITLQVPDALNFVANDTTLSGGQLTIGSAPTTAANVSTKLITVVGAGTSNSTTSAIAGPLQLFPGLLNNAAPSADPGALEGALQIGMAVKGTPISAYINQLACYTGTAQTAAPCSDVTHPLLGVYLTTFGCTGSTCSTGGSSAVITPPGRATVTSISSTPWTVGMEVCRDPSNPGDAVTAPSGACPLGQAVGVAVGDGTTNITTHLVDLDFSDQGVGSSGYWSAGPLSSGAAVTVLPNNQEYAYGVYVPSILAAGKLVLDITTGDNTTDTYSFGIFDHLGNIVAHLDPQTFPTGPTVYVVSFHESTVTFPPGKYYFGYTGTGALGSLTLIPFQAFLTPMAKASVASGTGGTLASFSPLPDAWAASGNGSAAFALAP